MAFYSGDHVEIKNRSGLTGVVQSSSIINGIRSYKVKFDDTTLIPDTMSYRESELSTFRSNPAMSRSYQSTISPWADYYKASSSGKSIESHCPKCDRKWSRTRSPVLNDEWKDCLVCNIRREDV